MTLPGILVSLVDSQSFPSRADIDACLLQDRYVLERRLRGLDHRRRSGLPYDQGLTALWQAIRSSAALVERRRSAVPVVEYPSELPVSERRDEIAALIERHPVVVLCGETGSGKSTQLPKICLDLGRGILGRIGHTQPRRIAARSLASRVSQELGRDLGTLVGYKIRFHDRVHPETSVKLMTDGILLAEIQQDRFLAEYDTLIIDEAHERSLNIDFLLGYLRQLLPKRPELKLIITSATIDPQRFAGHFGGAPIIEVSGRTYPVDVRYRPPEEESAGERDEVMQQAIRGAVDELSRVGRGDILVFLSGEREIRETAESLRKHRVAATEILPLYARLGPAEQARIFQPHGARRIVLATNVAETSLTVPGIHYVIDPGFARISRYSHRSKVQRLPVEHISQASAEQRKGRCGRVAAGVCIRLYAEDNFAARAEFTEPEILRTNLASVILQMKVLGFGEIERFPFLDPPDSRLISDGYRLLRELSALGPDGDLTPLGRQLARLPVDPRIGRMLLASSELHCLREVLVIAAGLSVQDPRERPMDHREAADQIHATFLHEDSDFLAFLNLWRFLEAQRRHLTQRKFRKLCELHFLSWNRVQEWHDIHQQLRALTHEMGLVENTAEGSYEEIHQALLTGLLSNLGFQDEGREYLGARNSRFFVHPSSGQFAKGPKWIMAAERVETTRQYGRIVARIQPEWVERAAPHLVQRSYSEPHWQAQSGQVAAYERVTLYGLPIVAKRRVNYGPINPTESREIFIRFALAEGDFETRAPFWRHNLELIDSIRYLEHKSRRRDLLVDEETIYAFYAARIPEGIYSKPLFERWLRQATRQEPKLLHMRIGDLMQREAEAVTQGAFPDFLEVGGTRLPLEYHFDPGNAADGVTLVVPLPLVNQVSPERCEWIVPGLLEERVVALLRGLPKSIRKQLVPIPDTAHQLIERLRPAERPLVQALSEGLRELKGLYVPGDAWDESAVPNHLRMGIRLVDDQGQQVDVGRDLARLKREHANAGEAQFARIPSRDLEREGITRWDFEALPEAVELDRGGIRLRGFPALVDRGDSVAIQVLDSADNAEHAMRDGLRRLLMFHLGTDVRFLRKNLPDLNRMRLQYALAPRPSAAFHTPSPQPSPTRGEGVAAKQPLSPSPRSPREGVVAKVPVDTSPRPLRKGARGRGTERLRPPEVLESPHADILDELVALILDQTFLEDRPAVRDRATFEARLADCRGDLMSTAGDVCKLIAGILDRYQALRQRLAATTQSTWKSSVEDLRQQLDALVFRGFPQSMPYEQIKSYPRYLRAGLVRLEKLQFSATQDQRLMAEMAPLLAKWRERSDAAQKAGRQDPRLDEIRWQLEELRVSLFAQQIGTAYPVSIQRIEKRWRELGL